MGLVDFLLRRRKRDNPEAVPVDKIEAALGIKLPSSCSSFSKEYEDLLPKVRPPQPWPEPVARPVVKPEEGNPKEDLPARPFLVPDKPGSSPIDDAELLHHTTGYAARTFDQPATNTEVKMVADPAGVIAGIVPYTPSNKIVSSADSNEDYIQAAFEKFHADNPDVYKKLVEFAYLAKANGHTKLGIKMLFERLRWYHMVEIKQDKKAKYKLNNNYTSRYARLIMKNEPALDGFFNTRILY